MRAISASFAGPRWEALAAKGARVQRLLWASTSTKNPKLRDVLYMEELIGKDTVNTIPPATMDAFRDHGVPRASLAKGWTKRARDGESGGCRHLDAKRNSGVWITAGVQQFEEAFAKLLAVIEPRRSNFSRAQ